MTSFALILGLSVISGGIVQAARCGDTNTSIIDCSDVTDTGNKTEDNGIWKILIIVIQTMTVGVGIAGVGGITYGAIRYATAGGNFATAKKALMIITNTAIGLGAYALMFALLNFIIPGGVLG